jgi:hypothetical protein
MKMSRAILRSEGLPANEIKAMMKEFAGRVVELSRARAAMNRDTGVPSWGRVRTSGFSAARPARVGSNRARFTTYER